MRTVKKLLASCLAAAFAFGLSASAIFAFGASRVSASEASSEQKELYARDSGVDSSLRLSVLEEVNADKVWYYNMTAYLGISEDGEGIDLSSVDSFKFYLRGYYTGNAYARVVLLDKNGGAARSSVTSGEAFFYNYDGTDVSSKVVTGAWQGYKTSGQDGYLQTARDKFQNYQHADWGTEGKTFDWTAVTTVAVYCNAYNRNVVDVGDVVAVTGTTETTLFDVSEATKAETAEVKSNEYFFGPTAGYLDDFYERDCNFTVTAANGNTVTITCTKMSRAFVLSSGGVWNTFYERSSKVKANEDVTYVDISDYDAFVVGVDASTTTTESVLQTEFRVDNDANNNAKKYRAFGNYEYAYFIAEDGTITRSGAANKIPAGFKGTVVYPYGAFQCLLDNSARFSKELSTDKIGIKFISDSVGGGSITIDNAKLVKNTEDFVNATAASYTSEKFAGMLPETVTDDNYEEAIIAVENAKSEYAALSEGIKAKVDYAPIAAAEAKISEFFNWWNLIGGSIRMEATLEKSGLRFAAELSKADYDKYADKIVGVGIILMPTDMIGEDEFVLENYNGENQAKNYFVEKSEISFDEGGKFQLRATLTKVYEENYDRNFTARAYILLNINGTNVYVYAADSMERSVYAVAKLALAQNETEHDLEDNEIKILQAYVSKVETED